MSIFSDLDNEFRFKETKTFGELCVMLAKEHNIMVATYFEMAVPNDGYYITLRVQKGDKCIKNAIHSSRLEGFGTDIILNHYLGCMVEELMKAIEELEKTKEKETHSCYTCKWECLDGCCLKLDDNGNREPVPDEPIVCEMYEER